MPLKDRAARRAYHNAYIERRLQEPEYKKKHLARAGHARKSNKARFAAVVAEFRRHGCRLCPEAEHCCLVAHHLDPKTKDFDIGGSDRHRVSIDRLRRELAKCVCLCHNCHAKVHAGSVTLPDWALVDPETL